MNLYLKDYIEPARQSARTALEEYQKGNKEPLAKIISRGMEFSDTAARISYDLHDTTQATLKMASYLTGLMERDPKLKELATADYEKRESAICASREDFRGLSMRTFHGLLVAVVEGAAEGLDMIAGGHSREHGGVLWRADPRHE